MKQNATYQAGDVLIHPLLSSTANELVLYGFTNYIEVHGRIPGENDIGLSCVAAIVESIVIHENLVVLPSSDNIEINTQYESVTKQVSTMDRAAVNALKDDDTITTIFSGTFNILEERNRNNEQRKDIKNLANQLIFYELISIVLAHMNGVSFRNTGAFGPYRDIGLPHIGNTHRYGQLSSDILNSITGAVNQDITRPNRLVRNYFKLEVPIIFNYVLEKAHTRQDIIPVALEFRESKEAQAFRKQLTLLDEAVSIDDRKTVRNVSIALRQILVGNYGTDVVDLTAGTS